jgi:hypothetical protein
MTTRKKKTKSRALERRGDGGALAVVDTDFRALQENPDAIREIILTNVGPSGLTQFDLERVKMPTGGATKWTMETVRGEKSVDEIEGIIVAHRPARVHWSEPIEKTGGNSPPDCASADGFVGIGDPGGECDKCILNAFGSDPKGGKGKACKELNLVFLLTVDKLLPTLIAVTPGSLVQVRKYFLGLANEGLPAYGVTTKFRLEKAKNSNGISFAKAKPTLGRELQDDEIEAVRAYAKNIAPALSQRVEVSRDEVDGAA